MRVLVIGSGGREHTLCWKLADSPLVSEVFAAPGNGGTAAIAQNLPVSGTDVKGLVNLARSEKIDLAVIGPEAPLVLGVVDALQKAGIRAFGPSAAAAQLEGSKAFAKRFMVEEGIPTAVAPVFQDYDTALAYLRRQEMPIVIKASGLAAGKGVMVCPTLQEAEEALHLTMVERAFGEAGDLTLIEDCLEGEEVSLLAFCDGRTVVPLVPARDYKRVGDGDSGPNTGGMGCYAPSPYLPEDLVREAEVRVLRPTIEGMIRRGTPYVGVLYAGLMLTDRGMRVLEFNCRFGDPETQVLLPLLDTDLAEIILACLEGRLDRLDIRWKQSLTTAVVMASGGYPGEYEKGKEITGVADAEALEDTFVFQAGTKLEEGELLTAGGRVLAVTSIGSNLDEARARAYRGVGKISFEGAQHRTDIAAGAQKMLDKQKAEAVGSSYAAAGVDVEAKMRIFERMQAAVERSYTDGVLGGMGSFGGLYSLAGLADKKDLVLVSSTDSVGTKTIIASAMGRYENVGHDIVNHCVNDVLVQGARPLFFLDYIAAGKLEPEAIVGIVTSCADACKAAGCALIGGETAEMPGVYRPGAFDLVGALVGWVERGAIIDGSAVEVGDACLGLPSSGLHTNGYSLARHVFGDARWETEVPELDGSIGQALLAPHRSYLPEYEELVAAGVPIKAMAHITGGGFEDNIPRVLPDGIGACLDRSAWEVPAIFRLIQSRGQVDEMEMYHVFNMGVGMVVLVAKEDVERALEALSGEAVVIGETVKWDGSGPRVSL
ncbi:MAG: phosphoribosylamine--glycine ligase [Anaerolineales bacterium]|nr:MAG: phosphoribosylamine--glycine ligase [Anaerolineales bacterium]